MFGFSNMVDGQGKPLGMKDKALGFLCLHWFRILMAGWCLWTTSQIMEIRDNQGSMATDTDVDSMAHSVRELEEKIDKNEENRQRDEMARVFSRR